MRKIHYFLLSLLAQTTFSFAQLKPVQYNDGSQVLHGFQANPAKKSIQKPGILILPAWLGIDKHSKDTALQLANLGFMGMRNNRAKNIDAKFGAANFSYNPSKALKTSDLGNGYHIFTINFFFNY